MRVRRLREAGALVTRIVKKGKPIKRRRSVAEGKVLFDAVFVRGMHSSGASQRAATLGILGLKQMPTWIEADDQRLR